MKPILVMILLIMVSLPTSGFRLTPMTQALDISSGGKKAVFHVKNESDKPIAVEISLAKRVMDKKGKEQHPDAGDLFIIFPDQLIVKPKEKRAISVTYLGQEQPVKEEAYRLIAEQLPVGLDKSKKRTNIKILLKYVAAFYIRPKKPKSDLRLKTLKTRILKKRTLRFVVRNEGSIHEILADYKLKVSSPKNSSTLRGRELKGFLGENVLSGHEREFDINVGAMFPVGTDVQLELTKNK